MAKLRVSREAKALRKNIGRRMQQQKFQGSRANKIMNFNYDFNNNHLDNLIIDGERQVLRGDIEVSGSKNSALPLIFASMLTDDIVSLNNVPNLSDIKIAQVILQSLNVKVSFHRNTMALNSSGLKNLTTNENLVGLMRASVLLLGPLLARHRSATIAMPGGCSIGARPIDIHLDCLKQMGASIINEGKFIKIVADQPLKGATIEVRRSSVGATENLIMAAVLAEGVTKIVNPAKEPEIVDLANMLVTMGAKIKGAGSNLIIIEGVEKLHGTHYTVCSDRIEAGSYAIATALTGGDVTLKNVDIKSLENVIEPLKAVGTEFKLLGDNTLRVIGNTQIKPYNIKTGCYPHFSTDLQPQWAVLMSQSSGNSIIEETVFDSRFSYVEDLKNMGADITYINRHKVNIRGSVNSLKGSVVAPKDLRASFALIIAGLVAEGVTKLENLNFLERGYEDVVKKLTSCGVNIVREQYSNEMDSLEEIDAFRGVGALT